MSCYICDKKTLGTVLKAWLMCDNTRPHDQIELEEAWAEIVAANYLAYNARYGTYDTPSGEEKTCPLAIEDWFYTPPQDRPSKYERYKALKEYMYQCAEGDYRKRAGYYKSQWCLDAMLKSYINE